MKFPIYLNRRVFVMYRVPDVFRHILWICRLWYITHLYTLETKKSPSWSSCQTLECRMSCLSTFEYRVAQYSNAECYARIPNVVCLNIPMSFCASRHANVECSVCCGVGGDGMGGEGGGELSHTEGSFTADSTHESPGNSSDSSRKIFLGIFWGIFLILSRK